MKKKNRMSHTGKIWLTCIAAGSLLIAIMYIGSVLFYPERSQANTFVTAAILVAGAVGYAGYARVIKPFKVFRDKKNKTAQVFIWVFLFFYSLACYKGIAHLNRELDNGLHGPHASQVTSIVDRYLDRINSSDYAGAYELRSKNRNVMTTTEFLSIAPQIQSQLQGYVRTEAEVIHHYGGGANSSRPGISRTHASCYSYFGTIITRKGPTTKIYAAVSYDTSQSPRFHIVHTEVLPLKTTYQQRNCGIY